MSKIDVTFCGDTLCLIKYPVIFEVGAFRQMLDDVTRLNPDNHPFATLLDMRLSSPWHVNAKARQEAAEIMRSRAHEYQNVCAARISESNIVRGMLTVFDWVSPCEWPRRTFRRGDVAENWVRSSLVKAKLPLPPKRLFTQETAC